MAQRLPRIARVALLVASVALIGWVDFQSGPDIGFSLFYLIPIVVAGWFEGIGAATIVAVGASVAWFSADYLGNPTRPAVTAWNGFTRLAIFSAIGALMAKLRAERESLRLANAELEAFTYTASHDLRSPLAHIGSYAAMLERHAGASLDEVATRYLSTIADSSRFALNLIDDLLDFSRMGRTEMRRLPVDLGALVDEVQRGLADAAGDRTIRWKIGALPTVNADAPMMRLVMQNLLENAVKYTRPRVEATIEVTAQVGNDQLIVGVHDNGVGFDNQYAGKLFRVFERLHRDEQFEGTGIGLAVVDRIVARHGGRAWAVGVLDKGASFYFSLPFRR